MQDVEALWRDEGDWIHCDVYEAGDRGEMASIAWGCGRNMGILHGVCGMGAGGVAVAWERWKIRYSVVYAGGWWRWEKMWRKRVVNGG